MPIIQALGRWKQEGLQESVVNTSYIARPDLKNKTKQMKNNKQKHLEDAGGLSG